ncbi:ACN9-domain-containing protein [Trametes maxima]|nr:ACN9-domain-containing protein [Trametes maxima]
MLRVTGVRLAESISKHPLNLREASAALLPPLPLYRRILRAHRHLPFEMRSLGDDYVKAEFRRHKETTNKVHIIGFLSQWKVYLDQLPSGPEAQSFRGKPLDPTVLEKARAMSAEQLGQLYEVMHVTKDVWKPVSPEQGGSQNTPDELEKSS